MKALPKEVTIDAYVYKIQYNAELSEEGLMGRIKLLHGIIEILPGMSPDMEETTLLHEVGHGYLFHRGIKEHDEKHLDVLSSGYMAFRRDNPGILK